jgi:hypothetical protein
LLPFSFPICKSLKFIFVTFERKLRQKCFT